MATRQNLCTNPALTSNATGWSGDGSAPARTAGAGFSRPNVAQYSSGTFIRTPAGAAARDQVYTLSVEILVPSAASGHIYIEWQRSDASVVEYTTAAWSAAANTVSRIFVTGTAPADSTVAAAAIVVDGMDLAGMQPKLTAVLMEQLPNPGFYFDGDTPGASWAGAAGSSASSWTQAMIRESGWAAPVAAATSQIVTSAAVKAGDIIVVAHARDYYAATAMTSPSGTISGWTNRATGDGGTNAMHVKIWTATAAADGATTVVANSTGTADSTMWLVFWVIDSSAGTLSVVGGAGQNGTASAASQTVAAVAGAAAGDLLLAVAGSGTFASGDYSSPLTLVAGGGNTPHAKMLEQDNPGFATVAVFQGVLAAADAAKYATFSTSETYGTAAVVIRASGGGGTDHPGTLAAAAVAGASFSPVRTTAGALDAAAAARVDLSPTRIGSGALAGAAAAQASFSPERVQSGALAAAIVAETDLGAGREVPGALSAEAAAETLLAATRTRQAGLVVAVVARTDAASSREAVGGLAAIAVARVTMQRDESGPHVPVYLVGVPELVEHIRQSGGASYLVWLRGP